MGMNICYDVSFPESSRIMALAGAELIALPTNWPPGAGCVACYAPNTRAMENHVYYIAVNREERGFRFIGQSRICEPNGNTLASADETSETILYAEIDPAIARNKHLVRVPGKHEIHRFYDRRPEMYGAIVEPVRRTSTAP
jgi:predicted amidohydrolase